VKPTLVYLYGPPASGKLTIAEQLSEITGFRLFHNHLTVNAIRSVLDFGTPPFAEVIHRLRLDVFRTALTEGISIIFTNSSAWGGTDGPSRFAAFASDAAAAAETSGGRCLFVQIQAPVEVLEGRVANDSRRAHNKLVDVARLNEMLDELDSSPLHIGDLVIDSSILKPECAARLIAAAIYE